MGIGQWGAFEIVDTNGTRLPPGTLIRVTVPPAAAPGGTLATLFTDLTGTTQGPNPVPLDQYSNLTFYAQDATQYGIQAVEASGTAPLEKVFLAGVSAGGAGTVTQVNAGTAVQITNPTSTPTVSVILGNTAGTAAAGNDPRFTQGAGGVTATIAGTYAIPIQAGTLDLTMQASTTIAMPTARQGSLLWVSINQDGTGNRVPTFTGVSWGSGQVPAWSTAPNAKDKVHFVCYDGSTWVGFLDALAAQPPASTGTFTRPFSSDSLWYRPVSAAIAAGAFYGRGDGSTNSPGITVAANGADVDYMWIIQGNNSFPSTTLQATGQWPSQNFGGSSTGRTMHIDPSLYIEASNPTAGGDLGQEKQNATAAYLTPDGATWINMSPLAIDPAGSNPYTGWTAPTFPDTLQTGRGRSGSIGASHLSAVGGALRPGELEGSNPITHALKVTISMDKYGRKDSGFKGGAGFTTPATTQDSYFQTGYNGSAWHMGALLAIRPQDQSAAIGQMTTQQGRNLVVCLVTYGCYVCEDSIQDIIMLHMDFAAVPTSGIGSGANAVRTDITKAFTYCYVVVNNDPPV